MFPTCVAVISEHKLGISQGYYQQVKLTELISLVPFAINLPVVALAVALGD